MLVTSPMLNMLHLDTRQLLLSVRGVQIVFEFFKMLDVANKVCATCCCHWRAARGSGRAWLAASMHAHRGRNGRPNPSKLGPPTSQKANLNQKGELDDLAFTTFMQGVTDLTESEAYNVFDVFDVDGSGSIEFDEFYLIVCMLIAIKDKQQKQFLWNHSRTCFELIDADGSNEVSRAEFETFAFMFNISKKASRDIFKDFDKDNSEELDYEEFRMFTMACLDKQFELDQRT